MITVNILNQSSSNNLSNEESQKIEQLNQHLPGLIEKPTNEMMVNLEQVIDTAKNKLSTAKHQEVNDLQ